MTTRSLAVLLPVGALARGLALADPDALAALTDAHDRGAAHVVVLGADTLGGVRRPAPRVHALDPVTVAVAHHARFPRWGFLAVAAPTREHPFNLARRILGAHHLASGRIGLALADDDPGLPLDAGHLPWATDAAPGAAVTADAALAVRELWNSWPAGSIVGDRDRGVYAEVRGVRRIDHEGFYRIAGPLPTPASELGEPVLVHIGESAETPTWAEATIDGNALTIDGIAVGSVTRAASPADLAPLASRATADEASGLRGILGLPPRVLDLSERALLYPTDAPVAHRAGAR